MKTVVEFEITTTKTYTVRTCPFCGSEDLGYDHDGSGNYNIHCKACDAMGPNGFSISEAIDFWDRRAP